MAKKKKGGMSKGLSAKTYKGLSKKRMAKKGTGNFDRIIFKVGESVVVQPLTGIDEFLEYEQHAFQDGSRWQYVPCAGDECPLCDDEDRDVAKTSYRFACNVWSFKEKKVKVLEGPKDLAGRLARRYEKRPRNFTKTAFEISKLNTTPVSYEVDIADEEDPIKVSGLKLIDLENFVTTEMKRYFGSELPAGGSKSALDDDDDEDDDAEDDEYDEDDLEEMNPKQVRKIAKSLGIKLEDKDGEKRKKSALIRLILKKQQ